MRASEISLTSGDRRRTRRLAGREHSRSRRISDRCMGTPQIAGSGKKGVNLLRYASNRGDADLRKAIAAYLCDFRAARCHPDQIVIVAGMQQAMLIAQWLC